MEFNRIADEVNINLTPVACGIGDCMFIASHIRRLVSHIGLKHSTDPHLFQSCYIETCPYKFQSHTRLRDHFRRYHPDVWTSQASTTVEERCQGIETEDGMDVIFVDDIKPEDTSSELYRKFVKWVSSESLSLRLALEHEYENPASRVKVMHEDFRQFVLGFHDKFVTAVAKRLTECGFQDAPLLQMLQNCATESALNTTKTQAKRFFSRAGYVAPKLLIMKNVTGGNENNEEEDNNNILDNNEDEDLIDSTIDSDPIDLEQNGSGPSQNPVSKKVHYVPILETLKQYLTHDDVVNDILQEVQSPHLQKFNDGLLFESHPLFRQDPTALRLILYMDEFEVCNPIGASRGMHKLFAVYFSVGNINQRCLSDLASIHLALLCEYRTAVKYTHEQVLKCVVDDINVLSTEGITVTTKDGYKRKWKGAIAFIAGDNKTQHDIAGFRGCFSSGRVCRFCMVDYSQLEMLQREEDCVLRTPEVHDLHLQYITQDPSLIPVYGVTRPSCFAALYFKCYNDMFAPDVLHDVLESLMVQHLYQLMRALHTKKVVKLRQFISLTSAFSYGRNVKNDKPRDIPKKLFQKNYSIVGSAGQKWTLFSLFTFSVGPHVPVDSEHWKLFLLAQEICDIILAPIVSYEWLPVLKNLIEKHHAMWVKLYPGTTVFKLHVLLHYARIMAILGPVRHLWTMRFEAFHQYFMRMSRRLKNFICITKSLSERFQRRACLRMSRLHALPPKCKAIGQQSLKKVEELCEATAQVFMDKYTSYKKDTEICKVKSVSWEGMKLSEGDFVIVGVSSDEVPIFLKICELFMLPNDVAFVGTLTYVVRWSCHYHAYEVHVSDDPLDYVCASVSDVCSPQSLNSYLVRGAIFIKLKFKAALVGGDS